MNTILPLGSIASNLNSPHETAGALIGALADFAPEIAADYQLRYREIKPTQRVDSQRLVDGVRKRLNRYAPPFCYVGHHPQDHSQWGTWIDLGQLHKAQERGKLVQVSHHPVKSRATYALEVNETGVRLFRRKGWEQLWEVR